MVSGRVFFDQMGYEVLIPHNPIRIISLVPSQTELLFHLGLNDQIVGITKFCIHPADKANKKVKIGGTKKFDFDKINALKPDLIIGNKEENYQEGIERLKTKYPVWMSDVSTINQALDMINKIGALVNKQEESTRLISNINIEINALPKYYKVRVLYVIWNKPIMAVGKNTFIDNMLMLAGFENVLSVDRYPELSVDQIKSLNPDIILLSSEPFPFSQKHKADFEEIFNGYQIEIVDGEMFSWYGSRLLKSTKYLNHLRNGINPTFSRSVQKEG
jgi:ABC-type Fe3+-hydroxamate transport system substrate-binding protein